MSGRRGTAGAIVAAVVAAMGIAVAVAAASVPLGASISVMAAGDESPPTVPTVPLVSTTVPSATTTVALPAVTTHPVDPALLAALRSRPGASAAQTVTQIVQLTIVGGELRLVTDRVEITLERASVLGGLWIGSLPPVRVIDGRGTHAGWRVRWSVASIVADGASVAPTAKVHLEPDTPMVVHGTPDGLFAGAPGGAEAASRTLFGAAPGSGGGTYESGGTVAMRSDAFDADEVVIELALSLD